MAELVRGMQDDSNVVRNITTDHSVAPDEIEDPHLGQADPRHVTLVRIFLHAAQV